MLFGVAIRFLRWTGLGAPLAKRVAPFVLAGALFALVGLGAGLWLHFHDRGVIESATNKANATFRADQIKAEREVGAAKEQRDSDDAAGQKQLEEKANEAENNGSSSLDAVWDGLWD